MFTPYLLGFCPIAIAEVRTEEGTHSLFVAINQTSKCA
jgi:hypothetical protein